MATRVQVVVDPSEREEFRAGARAEGVSLSEWMRKAAHERLRRQAERGRFDTQADLDRFFEQCLATAQAEDVEREPDWEDVKEWAASTRYGPLE